MVFHATGLPEAFQDMFARDLIEAWEVDSARVVDQGIVDSWNEIVYPVLTVIPVGWNHALNVCQWVHEHIAEIVSGVYAANRSTDLAVPPLSPLVHTEHVDSFVGLSQQGSVARDAAERVSVSLVIRRGRLLGCLPWALAPSTCHAPCIILGLGERGRNSVPWLL